MWDLPGPGIEPVSPALTGGFLTTAPQGKSPRVCFRITEFRGWEGPYGCSLSPASLFRWSKLPNVTSPGQTSSWYRMVTEHRLSLLLPPPPTRLLSTVLASHQDSSACEPVLGFCEWSFSVHTSQACSNWKDGSCKLWLMQLNETLFDGSMWAGKLTNPNCQLSKQTCSLYPPM